MNDASFLSQLEQRTEQVKITLANLEAERVRIEGLISRLQPLVPHYDALIAAERAIDESRIELDALAGTPREESQGFAPEHMRSEHVESSGGEQGGEYGGEQSGGGEQPSQWQAAPEQTESVWGN